MLAIIRNIALASREARLWSRRTRGGSIGPCFGAKPLKTLNCRILDFVALDFGFVAPALILLRGLVLLRWILISLAAGRATSARPGDRRAAARSLGVSMSTITPASGASTSTSSAALSEPISRRAPSSPSQAHRRVEQASPEKHRVAPPAPACRRCRKRVLVRQEAVDHGVDQPRLDPGHVAEEDKRARDIGRHGGKPDPQRRREAARKFRIVDGFDVEARERRLHRGSSMAGHDDHRTSPGRERRFRRHPHDRFAAELLDKLRRASSRRRRESATTGPRQARRRRP